MDKNLFRKLIKVETYLLSKNHSSRTNGFLMGGYYEKHFYHNETTRWYYKDSTGTIVHIGTKEQLESLETLFQNIEIIS